METKAEKYTNHLIHESSPYLQQHAHNPVNWYPWGEEAFNKAREEDRPIFLSIGYSTCHWCHVMERETFENEEFAPSFNDHFVCIKVDREERPDLDQIYMNFTHALTGSGGWPMNIFLTPELKPFYAATYIPPKSSQGMPGILDVLEGIRDIYKENKGRVETIAESVVKQIQGMNQKMRQDRKDLSENLVDELFENLQLRFDPVFRGFGTSPKFPTPQNLIFLLNFHRLHKSLEQDQPLTKDSEATSKQTSSHNSRPSRFQDQEHSAFDMVKETLESMYRGGIYDHVAGGLSRYSVDRQWLVPHFEKMLYDNAFLMQSSALAYGEEPLPLFKNIYDRTWNYLKESMISSDGLFFSAEDADSEGVEGKFYVFSEMEIDDILGSEALDFKKAFHVTSRGNFEGKNILNLIGSDLDVAVGQEQAYRPQLEKIRAYRDQRIRPHRDEKILFSWNAMLVRALAIGAQVFQDQELESVAEQTMKTLLEKMKHSGSLYTSIREEILGPNGVLDDYAYGAYALLALYESTQKAHYLLTARDLVENCLDLFWDKDHHGFHLAMKDTENLIMNPVEPYDSAIPSGNGIMTKVLMELSLYTHDTKYRNLLTEQLNHFSGVIYSSAESVVTMADALQSNLLDHELAIVTGKDKATIKETLSNRKLPHYVQFLPKDSPLRTKVEFLGQLSYEDQVVLYTCKNGACSLPQTLN